MLNLSNGIYNTRNSQHTTGSPHTRLEYEQKINLPLERFSFERRKVIGFAITMPHDWLKKLAPHFHPIRSKTKTNRNSLARVFPRFASATCNYYEFWLVYCNVYGFGDWLEWLLWFWFYDAKLKTAQSRMCCVLWRPFWIFNTRVVCWCEVWNRNLRSLGLANSRRSRHPRRPRGS